MSLSYVVVVVQSTFCCAAGSAPLVSKLIVFKLNKVVSSSQELRLSPHTPATTRNRPRIREAAAFLYILLDATHTVRIISPISAFRVRAAEDTQPTNHNIQES